MGPGPRNPSPRPRAPVSRAGSSLLWALAQRSAPRAHQGGRAVTLRPPRGSWPRKVLPAPTRTRRPGGFKLALGPGPRNPFPRPRAPADRADLCLLRALAQESASRAHQGGRPRGGINKLAGRHPTRKGHNEPPGSCWSDTTTSGRSCYGLSLRFSIRPIHLQSVISAPQLIPQLPPLPLRLLPQLPRRLPPQPLPQPQPLPKPQPLRSLPRPRPLPPPAPPGTRPPGP